MERLSISFLSCLLVLLYGCRQPSQAQSAVDCANRFVQDSLMKHYIDSGADKLPGMYNNPAWQLYCDSVIALCPGIAAAWQLKAVPYIKNGEYEKAFAYNDIAVRLDPKGYTAYRGFLKCIFTKDYEGALVDFRQAEQYYPRGYEMDHTYPFYEGLCNLELGNYPAAEQNFKQDIFIQTGGKKGQQPHFNTLLYTGILYYEMKNDTLAKEYLLQCLAVYSQLPEANYYLAMVYGREGNMALQKKYLQTARQSYKDGYRINEDNIYYANYPHEVKLYEIEQALGAQVKSDTRLLHFTSSHTSFPDSGRAKGHLYDSVLYTAAEHYNDSSVLLVIPPHFNAGEKVDMVYWFHGWRNNIDTAAVFYELTRQLAASRVNAVLVLAETAKNAPDSYGGKLEQPGVFKGLVNDVMTELKKNHIVSRSAMPGTIALAGHSGAFRVIAYILQNGQVPVQEVLLFDALYSQVDKYMGWISGGEHRHFVHWYTNKGGGTDIVSDTMMQQLKNRHIDYMLTEEAGLQPAVIKKTRVLFVHSPREHNVIINRPDDFQLLLENSPCLRRF